MVSEKGFRARARTLHYRQVVSQWSTKDVETSSLRPEDELENLVMSICSAPLRNSLTLMLTELWVSKHALAYDSSHISVLDDRQ